MRFHFKNSIFYPTLVTIALLFIYFFYFNFSKSNSEKSIEQSLKTVMSTTEQALVSWSKSEVEVAEYWAKTPLIQASTKELLKIYREYKNTPHLQKKLIESMAQKDLRDELKNIMHIKSFEGYFIISKDLANLASSRDNNIGIKNSIYDNQDLYETNALKKAFEGQSVLSHPTISHVKLNRDIKRDFRATMFTFVPIKMNSGEIDAIFAFRINPEKDYTQILKRGRLGESGESYTFNKKAIMLSDSRFKEQLFRIGLLNNSSQSSMARIRVHNPMYKLKEHSPPIRYDQKNLAPTLAVKNAINQSSTLNVKGYLDYRGIEVIGAWTWIPSLNLGLTTEIDFEEAFRFHYYNSFLVLGIFIFLIFFTWIAYFLIKKRQESTEQLKEVELVNQAKSDLLATMSHEIRTPMNGILGMITLLRETSLTQEQENMIETVQSSGQSLLTILNDILDYSKINAQKLDLEAVDFDLHKAVNDVCYLFEGEADKKKISIDYFIEKEVPKYINGDETRIKQILTNLLSNAVKFTSEGIVKIEISTTLEKDIQLLNFKVKDTGVGIDQETQERLFQSFMQADSSISRKFGGTGLGLFISLKLVNMMNGNMQVTSAPGAGTTFDFFIPLIKATMDIQKISNEKTFENLSKDYPHNILVAEDTKINQKIILMFLKKLGYKNVTIVENGKKAIEEIEKTNNSFYDLIFMDMQMPVMNGLEAAKYITSHYSPNPPHIIAFTANAFEQDRKRCLESGMNSFLSKPVQLEDLKKTLVSAPPANLLKKSS